MSRRRRKRSDLPPPSRVPRNVDELGHPILPVEEYSVNAWCPARDGKGPMTQVHMLFNVPMIGGAFAVRLKTREACNKLIDLLVEYRNIVWPTPDEVEP